MAITPTSFPPIRLSSPEDLLAATPYLLGFHPDDSIAFLGLASADVRVTGRYDLSGADSSRDPTRLVTTLTRQGVDSMLLLGYGPAVQVTPDMDAIRGALDDAGIPVREALRVTDGRYWSYLCSGGECCPIDGTPFDLSSQRVSAAMTFAGLQALPSRADLVASITTGDDDPRRARIRTATAQVAARLKRELLDSAPDTSACWDNWRDEGVGLLHRVVDDIRTDGSLPEDEDLAALAVMLTHSRIRDEAWALVDEHGPHLFIPLWICLTRYAEPEHATSPALLLAYAAWRAGNGALARIAVERALELEPGHRLGLMLTDVLDAGIPPTDLPPMSREWIAATYEEEVSSVEVSNSEVALRPPVRPAVRLRTATRTIHLPPARGTRRPTSLRIHRLPGGRRANRSAVHGVARARPRDGPAAAHRRTLRGPGHPAALPGAPPAGKAAVRRQPERP